ncbi:MAG: NAD-dependent epimerase/dehydratase family protein [Deltaproteobacteria bacterium]|jgi:UDP-glucose 4-epimerase|nr:NAD-dependent epimerase/dehydratase family protein [Deltaproteobacteria bacterium]
MKTAKIGLALVTGGAGFIGSHLSEGLLRLGYGVRVLDNLSSGSLGNLEGAMGKGLEFVQGDILDRALVGEACQGATHVFHLAAMASVPQSLADPLNCLSVNGEGTLNVFEGAAAASARRLVFASTSAVYGDLPGPHGEWLATRADTPYAACKLLGENFAAYYREHRGLPTVSLRYFNVYGPRQSFDGPDSGVIPKFIGMILAGEAPLIHGDGDQTRDFIHVLDVVAATIVAGTREGASGVYNVATGTPVRINDLSKLLMGLCPGSKEPAYLPPRPGDPLQSWGSVERAAADLGFKPRIPLAEGLKGLLEGKAPLGGEAIPLH